MANRILSVGSEKRALMLAEYLAPPAPGRGLFMLESSRGFLTITGRFLGVPLSIVVTHMGLANADFVVRENRCAAHAAPAAPAALRRLAVGWLAVGWLAVGRAPCACLSVLLLLL